MKLVKAAVAFRRAVRGSRSVFDVDRFPSTGFFCAGIKRSCVHFYLETALPLLADVRVVCDAGAAGLARLRSSVEAGSLPIAGSGLGCLLGAAVWLRSAAPMAIAFFGLRRFSDVDQLLGGDVRVDAQGGVVDLEVDARETSNWGGSGGAPHFDGFAGRGLSRTAPVRMAAVVASVGEEPRSRGPDVGARGSPSTVRGFCACQICSGYGGARERGRAKKGAGGPRSAPRRGCACLFSMNGMSREATREPGAVKPLASWEACRTRKGPRRWRRRCAAPSDASRCAIGRAIEAFVKDLDRDVS